MRGRKIILGVLWYLAGAAALLIIALFVKQMSFFHVVSAGDTVVLVLGAILIGLAALMLQKVEVLRPSPATRSEGSRPRDVGEFTFNGDFSWSSLAAIFGAALALAVTPPVEADEHRVENARGTFERLVIDGDRDGTDVVMRHHDEEWWTKTGRAAIPCGRCHHLNVPGEEGTPCAECHVNMGAPASVDVTGDGEDLEVTTTEEPAYVNDIFDHDFHAAAEGGNEGCSTCHPDDNAPRTRDAVRACADCHSKGGNRALQVMVPEGSTIPIDKGLAPSYFRAMHSEKLCLGCHQSESRSGEELAQCSYCHRDREGQAPSGQ